MGENIGNIFLSMMKYQWTLSQAYSQNSGAQNIFGGVTSSTKHKEKINKNRPCITMIN